MTATAQPAADEAVLWRLPAMRGIGALVVGLGVPFVQLHSAVVGLWSLATLAVLGGVALVLGRRCVPEAAGRWPLAAGTFSILAGVVAAVFALTVPTATALGLTIAAWAGATGAMELIGWWELRGARAPRVERLGRDWRTVGVLTAVFALVCVFVRDEVFLTGLVGAYAVIVGVYHAVAALSIRPARAATAVPAGAAPAGTAATIDGGAA